ncbi:hypothetical protein FACS1894167_10400 [Synergistales bacterium]|nr:hypothetical protein FACS1894167_10400 [Synergistales bacterium]
MLRKRGISLYICSFISLLCVSVFSSAAGAAAWNAKSDLLRVADESPSIAAFPDAEGIVLLSHYLYKLLPDGSEEKTHRTLIIPADKSGKLTIPYTAREGAVVLTASWLDSDSGKALAPLDYTFAPLKQIEVTVPPGMAGQVIALETVTVIPRRYNVDDCLTLAGDMPRWEQRVDVEFPEGMDIYWQGVGVRNPSRALTGGLDRASWALTNQGVIKESGFIDARRPTLAFSLRQGTSYSLRGLSEAEGAFHAPNPPSGLSSSSRNLKRDGNAIERLLREDAALSPKDAAFTAAKWFEALGYKVQIFWSPKMEITKESPDCAELWREPLLTVSAGNKETYYFTPSFGFGPVPAYLSGKPVYRYDGDTTQRTVMPSGPPALNSLTGTWQLSLGADGAASGSLEINVTGGWIDVLSMGRVPSSEDVAAEIQKAFVFGVPNMAIEDVSVKESNDGYRVTLNVRAPLGIVGGKDMLVRLPGFIPAALANIPRGGEFSFSFPFIFNQVIFISTPKGYYRSVTPPEKSRAGDGNSTIDKSIVHWEKRARIEAECKWTVRTLKIDAASASRITSQMETELKWADTGVPLRAR